MGRFFRLAGIAVVGSGISTAALADTFSETDFKTFITRTKEVCLVGKADRCIDLIWAHLDGDLDGQVSVAEATTFLNAMEEWNKVSGSSVKTRATVTAGLAASDLLGVERIFAKYDTDGDAMLSREEATADVAIDDRRIAEIMSDESAIDRDGLSDRFGGVAGTALYKLVLLTGKRLEATPN